MMKQQLYAILDEKAALYLPPFTSQNDNTAIREFSAAIGQEGHKFNTHSEDFSLWALGSFDQETGAIQPNDPKIVTNALTVRERMHQLAAERDRLQAV